MPRGVQRCAAGGGGARCCGAGGRGQCRAAAQGRPIGGAAVGGGGCASGRSGGPAASGGGVAWLICKCTYLECSGDLGLSWVVRGGLRRGGTDGARMKLGLRIHAA